MRILFVSSEVYPFSKTGGLADVAGSLPAALAELGHEVLVVTPWYASLRSGRPLWIGDVGVPFDGSSAAAGVGTLERDGVAFAFVGHEAFRREQLYGYADDVERFCLFTRAVPQVAARVDFLPDLVHIHDWHTGFLPLVLRYGAHLPEGFPGLPSVLTIHNAQYQGESGIEETVRWLRLPGELSSRRQADEEPLANSLRSGCELATRVTTVSPSYAEELMTAEYGYGLEDTFRRIRDKFVGILNGLDTDVWDPSRDRLLPRTYSPEEPAGKQASKVALCKRAGLSPDRPLLGVVSRLAQQKGIDVLLDAATGLIEQGWSLFLLGSGEARLEARINEMSRNSEVAAHLAYDEELAHLVYAGADALAIPSRFEPCGLSQMIAMRYGTLPLARSTGGLRDTIENGRTGFLFEELTANSLLAASAQAMEHFGNDRWGEMRREAMSLDFSWQRSAEQYVRAYERAIDEKDGKE